MNITQCDRCLTQAPDRTGWRTIATNVVRNLTGVSFLAPHNQLVDLCPDCGTALDEWLTAAPAPAEPETTTS